MKRIKLFEDYNQESTWSDDVKEYFPEQAEKILELTQNTREPKKTTEIMDELNTLIKGYGVEVINGEWWDHYYQDIILEYINMGDTYAMTIIHDPVDDKFSCSSWGDWVEANEELMKSNDAL